MADRLPARMAALCAHRRGGPERLALSELPVPQPATGDVLVAVHAASLTPDELGWRSSWTDRLGRDRTPVVPAHEVSGTVVELGPGTSGFTVGDAVYGLTGWYRDGAAATHVAVEARNLAARPRTLDDVAAACVPLAGSAAWQALFDHGRLRAGERVLIHGACGGVGAFAVQLARSVGAEVIATGRHPDRGLLADLGAQQVIDATERFEDVVGTVDIVLDLVGGDVPRRSWPLLRRDGTLVSLTSPEPADCPRREARWVFFAVEPDRRVLRELARSLDAGELRSVVGAVFPLAAGREAFEAKARGGVPGKVALRVDAVP